jgi:hypothetical protein
MNDDATISMRRQPRLGNVLLLLLAMALFLFALQPREHVHGGRRREAETREQTVVRRAFDASL